MTAQEQAKRFAEAAPQLNKAEREGLNDLFPAYLFRRNRTGEVWTTCCGQHRMLGETNREWEIRRAEHQKEATHYYEAPPKPETLCPYCGRPVIVKELGRTGKRENLECWRRAVVLRWYRGRLWATAYDLHKEYGTEERLMEGPRAWLVAVYRFRPGRAEGTVRSFYNQPFRGIEVQNGPLTGGRWNSPNPFYANAQYGVGYDLVGLEELEKSPFRYCGWEEANRKFSHFLKYLTACCFYPRQIEMLMKAGMEDVVRDLCNRGVKHQTALDWETENPKEFFRVPRQQQKAFLNSKERNIDAVELYRRMRGKEPMEACCRYIEEGIGYWDLREEVSTYSLDLRTVIRYLDRNREWGYGGTGRGALSAWRDYLQAAKALGYPLHRENVLMPTPLGPAHDRATGEYRERLQEEQRRRNEEYRRQEEAWKKERAEQLAKAQKEYGKRRAALEKKYGYEADGYLIRVPEDGEEIRREGMVLKHCVAGYADRHITGKTTILFMRKKRKPGTPWITIEMTGNKIRQIHGYRNEGLYTTKGAFARDPREAYRAFLDPWLAWLEAGSRRDKDGKPVLPKNKEVKIA